MKILRYLLPLGLALGLTGADVNLLRAEEQESSICMSKDANGDGKDEIQLCMYDKDGDNFYEQKVFQMLQDGKVIQEMELEESPNRFIPEFNRLMEKSRQSYDGLVRKSREEFRKLAERSGVLLDQGGERLDSLLEQGEEGTTDIFNRLKDRYDNLPDSSEYLCSAVLYAGKSACVSAEFAQRSGCYSQLSLARAEAQKTIMGRTLDCWELDINLDTLSACLDKQRDDETAIETQKLAEAKVKYELCSQEANSSYTKCIDDANDKYADCIEENFYP